MSLAGPDEPGVRIVIDGIVVDSADCETPLPGAVVDLWHADDSGLYDNEGFELRGRYGGFRRHLRIETILPGRHDSRPVRHIHFKVWSAEGDEVLTSQIYFEGDESHNPAAHPGPLVGLDADGRASRPRGAARPEARASGLVAQGSASHSDGAVYQIVVVPALLARSPCGVMVMVPLPSSPLES